MSALFLCRSRRLVYLSGICTSATIFSTTKPISSSSIFTDYLDEAFNNFDEKLDGQSTNTNICKILSAADCRQLFTMQDAIRIQGEAFVSMYNKETIVPPRIILSMPQPKSDADDTLFKPSVNSDVLGQKVVSVRPNNPRLYNLPSITGCIILWNKDTGLTQCVMDAQFITGRRTAAGSGLATDLFATSHVNVLTVFGAGTQAMEHIKAVLTVRNTPKTLYIVNRSLDKANKLKHVLLDEIHGDIDIITIALNDFQKYQYDQYAQVISDADVICTCTNSEAPLFDGKLLKSNVHINAVGAYKPNMIELDASVAEQCYIFVDSVHAFQAGDLYHYFDVEHDDELKNANKRNQTKWREIGEYVYNDVGQDGVCNKQMGKPVDVKFEKQKTLFKSVGVAAQDLHSAYFVYGQAVNDNIGTDVNL
eukprot:550225_1